MIFPWWQRKFWLRVRTYADRKVQLAMKAIVGNPGVRR